MKSEDLDIHLKALSHFSIWICVNLGVWFILLGATHIVALGEYTVTLFGLKRVVFQFAVNLFVLAITYLESSKENRKSVINYIKKILDKNNKV